MVLTNVRDNRVNLHILAMNLPDWRQIPSVSHSSNTLPDDMNSANTVISVMTCRHYLDTCIPFFTWFILLVPYRIHTPDDYLEFEADLTLPSDFVLMRHQ